MKKIKIALLVGFLVYQEGCYRSPKSLLNQGLELVQKQDYLNASEKFESLVDNPSASELSLKAAKEGAQISFFQLKDYDKALKFYRYLVLNSENQQDRLLAQTQIISIYFDHKQDYKSAIKEISTFIFLNGNNNELGEKYKLDLARCYLHLESFAQALQELEALIKSKSSKKTKVEALLLMGNIYLNQKDNVRSSEVFRQLLNDHLERALKEKVPILLSVVLEENNDFKGAIEVLKKYETQMENKEYIELRRKKLEERIRNAPGTKGFRK